MRGYAICGERRSGSLFLCNLLTSTGVLGKPSEYFCTDAIRSRIPDYPADPEDQLQMIPKLAATPNGVYGLKLHAVEFDRVKGTRWAERLPSLSFIYLERRDVLAQAISFVRARQTEQWTSTVSAKRKPVYDGARINQTLLYLLQQQIRWRYYLARNGGPRLHLIYCGFRRLRPGKPIERGHAFRSKAATLSDEGDRAPLPAW